MVEALAANDDPEGAYEVIQGALADPNTRGVGSDGSDVWEAKKSNELYDDDRLDMARTCQVVTIMITFLGCMYFFLRDLPGSTV